ncbi:hypothetical protein TNCV_3035251 [Trichonephila clavipes]|nr:hypothetical protein TNCV_3035251 [Trichonephila clavipes]
MRYSITTSAPFFNRKLPTWLPKKMPTWLYHQHFAMFPLYRHYNVAAIRDISRSCLDPNDFTVLNCIVKGHASLSPLAQQKG